MQNDSICVLCGAEITNFGNNPWPLQDDGRCCDDCNDSKVIPARLQSVAKLNKKKENK